MKKIWPMILIIIVFVSSCVIYLPPPDNYPPPTSETYSEYSLDYFYDYLAEYGYWLYQPPYGYVWIPEVNLVRWRPYSYGYWVWTDFGWTWISRFDWGWATFHYGRWGWSPDIGWFWVPGDIWAPAWVVWRYSRYYIGWAPLPPSVRFDLRIGLTSLPSSLPAEYWIFVDNNYFLNSRLHRYILPVERNLTLVRKTSLRARLEVRNQVVHNRGLDKYIVEQDTQKKVRKYELTERNSPGTTRVRINNVEIFRPKVKLSSTSKPKRVVEKEKIKNKIEQEEIIVSGEQKSVSNPQELEKVHQEEKKLLEQSHQIELRALSKELKEKKAQARTPQEQKQVEESYRQKIRVVTQEHEQEKKKLIKRQEEEKKKVVRQKTKKVKKKEKKKRIE